MVRGWRRRWIFAAVLLVATWYYLSAQPQAPRPREGIRPDRAPASSTRQVPGRLPGAIPEVDVPSVPADAALDGSGQRAALLVPVEGVPARDLVDTFMQARAEGRSHEAIDIMAPAGTPVVAVDDGHVEKLFTSVRGGLTLYQFDPTGRFAYYYAHLQQYAVGVTEQGAVTRGQVIGYVGSTGNANAAAPHLHFAIFALGPEREWWKGTAIDPYPILIGRASPD